MSDGIPCILRLTTARNTFTASPDFDLGRWSKPMAALGSAVAIFSVATISLPAVLPSNKDNLNCAPRSATVLPARLLTNFEPADAPVVLGAAIALSLLLWPFSASRAAASPARATAVLR